MKKILPKSIYLYIISLGWTNVTYAQVLNPLKVDSFSGIIKNLAQAVTTIGVPLAGIFIIYSGFLFVTSQGSEEKLKKAKTTFYYTIIGTVLIVGAWAIAKAIDQFAQSL